MVKQNNRIIVSGLILTICLFFASNTAFAQSLNSIEPDSAYQGDDLWVTITGSGTHFSQSSSSIVWFVQGSSTIYAGSAYPTSATSLNAQFIIPGDAPSGYWDLYVDDDYDPVLSLPEAFRILIPYPMIISVDPDSAYRNESLMVTITGQHTWFGQASTTAVWFSQGSSTISGYGINVYSSEQLSAWFSIPPDVPFGFWDVWVRDLVSQNTISVQDSFEVMYRCGDTNADNEINVTDIVWIVNYIFIANAPTPYPLNSAEVNCDGLVNITDAVWLILYVFQDGYAPCHIDVDGIPDC
ncbi:MAG: hypothetical protein GF310_09715 [candidate division Zixibacteria bacterium]|nr:hypothetical protein [candidate division Zixibacteria bacterium]